MNNGITLTPISINNKILDSTQETIKNVKFDNPIHLKKNLFNNKKLWSKIEDEKLIKVINEYGSKNWKFISNLIGTRNSKQCRERWSNHLNPNKNKKSKWTLEEENILIEGHKIYGNSWSLLCKLLPGRSENNIKNYWNSNLKIRKKTFFKKKIKLELSLFSNLESLYKLDIFEIKNLYKIK